MASNYCAESFEARLMDCEEAHLDGITYSRVAITRALHADLSGAMKALDDALAKLSSMRSDLQDLAYEAERKKDRDAGL